MERHHHANIWENLPIGTVITERDRIAEVLAEVLSKSETINQIINERQEEAQAWLEQNQAE